MGLSVFDHPWFGALFGDDAVAELFSAEVQIGHMLRFEAALSRALGSAGLADPAMAERAAVRIEGLAPDIDMAALARGTARDGLPVPALVAQIRAAAGEDGAAVHTGATSQDVMDTALVLALRAANDMLDARLERLIAALDALARAQGAVPLMGRTRMQAALPITVADRLATWAEPLVRHRARLTTLRPMVECLQFGGAVGTRNGPLAAEGAAVAAALGAALGLSVPGKAWHAMRDGVADYAGWLALVSGSLGKIGQDISLMAQQGVDEIALAGGGGSSAMPHKANPILAELLVTLARFNATQVAGMHQAMVHEQERSGAAWALEWMILPQMVLTTGRALGAALALTGRVERIGTPS